MYSLSFYHKFTRLQPKTLCSLCPCGKNTLKFTFVCIASVFTTSSQDYNQKPCVPCVPCGKNTLKLTFVCIASKYLCKIKK
jgi:hypothetical protein